MTQKTRQIKKKGNSCIRFFFLSLRGAVEINTKLHLPQSASEAEDTSYERDAHAISPITWSDGSGSLSALRNAISLVAGRKARQDPPQASDWFEYLLQITFPFLFPPPAQNCVALIWAYHLFIQWLSTSAQPCVQIIAPQSCTLE